MKPKSAIEKVKMTLWLPLEVRAALDLHLVSDLEGRVPHGAYIEFFSARTKEYLEWETLDLGLFGGPAGYFVKGPKEMIQYLKGVVHGR